MSMTDEELERDVDELRSQIEAISESGHVRLEDFRSVEEIQTRLYPLERELARRRLAPFATPVEWPSRWHKEDYGPETRAASGTATIIHGVSELPRPLVTLGYAVIHIEACSIINRTGAAEHAYRRHPLFGAGLQNKGVYLVENSGLLAFMGSLHDPDSYFFEEKNRKRHYMFAFEAAFVDCLAGSVHQVGMWPTLKEARAQAEKILFPSR
jgi:hypothetical protein